MSEKLELAVDFDGTICSYDGWQGEAVCGQPYEKTKEFLEKLSRKFRVTIFSARASTPGGKQAIWDWVEEHEFKDYISDVTNEKRYSFVAFVDDRAVPVANGQYDSVLRFLNID